MSNFDTLASGMNAVLQTTFGDTFTLTKRDTGIAYTLTGIIETGLEQEDTDRGTYLWLSCKVSDFTIAPERGDLVTLSAKDYKVVDIDADAGGMLRMRLRAA